MFLWTSVAVIWLHKLPTVKLIVFTMVTVFSSNGEQKLAFLSCLFQSVIHGLCISQFQLRPAPSPPPSPGITCKESKLYTQSTKKYHNQLVIIQLVQVLLLLLFLLFFITARTAVNYRPLPCSTAGATFPSEDSKNLSTFSNTISIFLDSISNRSDCPSFCLEDTRSDHKRKKTIIG